jgi:tetratricopeptide (TPR) repeat protein
MKRRHRGRSEARRPASCRDLDKIRTTFGSIGVTNHALKAPRQARSENTLNKIVRAVEELLEVRSFDDICRRIEVLRRAAGAGGVAAVSARLREMVAAGSSNYVSSYVPGNAFVALQRTDRKPEEALAVLQVGVELFPRNSFLLTRLGEVYAARNERNLAIAAYRRALDADPFNRVAAVQLQRLGASP